MARSKIKKPIHDGSIFHIRIGDFQSFPDLVIPWAENGDQRLQSLAPNTFPSVFQMIQKSNRQLRSRTYCMSYRIHSWKSVFGRRVLQICQSPVMPGRTLNLASRHAGQNWFSMSGLGRGPTTFMSPLRTLKNCGSSCRWNRRSQRPTRSSLGSSSM